MELGDKKTEQSLQRTGDKTFGRRDSAEVDSVFQDSKSDVIERNAISVIYTRALFINFRFSDPQTQKKFPDPR
jgi:hypothetical protein